MTKPIVSVVIPCYNHGKYLNECIDSVKKQTYGNFEIIVVNDGSTDVETSDIISRLDDTIKVVQKKNGGLSSARNAGIAASTGQFILPLDADDKIGATYIEKAVALFQNESADLVFCAGQYFGAENCPMNNAYTSYRSELLYNAIFCSCIYRRADYDVAGPYKENMTKGMEDWDFLVRFLSGNKKVVQIPEVLFYYRRAPGSMWDTLQGSEVRIEMENRLFKNNLDVYLNEWGSIISILREYEILKRNCASSEEAMNIVKKSASYRLGNFLLSPFKIIRKNFR